MFDLWSGNDSGRPVETEAKSPGSSHWQIKIIIINKNNYNYQWPNKVILNDNYTLVDVPKYALSIIRMGVFICHYLLAPAAASATALHSGQIFYLTKRNQLLLCLYYSFVFKIT